MKRKVMYCNICKEQLHIHESYENHGYGIHEKVVDIHCPNNHEWDRSFNPMEEF